MSSSTITLISESLYEKNISLRELIERACNKGISVDYGVIVNIIVRFIFVYRYPEKTDSKNTSLQEIEELISLYIRYVQIRSYSPKRKNMSSKNPVTQSHLDFISQSYYQVKMLIDIAATSEIFMEIALRKPLQSPLKDQYIWLDIGTGSGILLLAQYIQARRQGYRNIKNIGIDNSLDSTSPLSLHGKILAKNLDFWEILYGDTSKIETYKKLSLSHVSHISNETIPHPYTNMLSSYSEKRDPFFSNYAAVFYVFWNSLKNTSFFPTRLEVSIGRKSQCEILSPRWKFQISWDTKIIKAHRIYLNGIWKKLEEVWECLYIENIIPQNPHLKFRWKKELK